MHNIDVNHVQQIEDRACCIYRHSIWNFVTAGHQFEFLVDVMVVSSQISRHNPADMEDGKKANMTQLIIKSG